MESTVHSTRLECNNYIQTYHSRKAVFLSHKREKQTILATAAAAKVGAERARAARAAGAEAVAEARSVEARAAIAEAAEVTRERAAEVKEVTREL
jgi:hypothetical protein